VVKKSVTSSTTSRPSGTEDRPAPASRVNEVTAMKALSM